MTHRRTRTILRLATAGLTAGGVGCLALAVLGEPEIPETGRAAPAVTTAARGPAGRPGAVPLSAYEPLWDLDLRRSLTDAPPRLPVAPATNPAPPAAPAANPPPVRLAATVIEPGYAVAMLQDAAGKVEMRRVGDRVGGGAELVRIDPGSVVVRGPGGEAVIRLERGTAAVAPGRPGGPPADGRSPAAAVPLPRPAGVGPSGGRSLPVERERDD